MLPDPSDCCIFHLAFDRHGKEVRAVGLDGVRIRPLEPPLPVSLAHELGLYPYASDVVFGLDGRWLASSGWDGKVRIWDVATRQPITELDAKADVGSSAINNSGSVISIIAIIMFRLWRAAPHRFPPNGI